MLHGHGGLFICVQLEMSWLLIEELQTCYATTTAVNLYKSFKPPPVVADDKFLFDWDDQVGNAFEFELGEDDMPEGDVEGQEPVFELLSGGLDAEETRKEAAGKAAKQSCVDVLHQVEQIRPGFLAELGAVKHTSGIMPTIFWWFKHP
ncbi:TPA: hypothetical protein ACH3X1_009058 [Trebouxia sp. C0004]